MAVELKYTGHGVFCFDGAHAVKEYVLCVVIRDI